MRNIEVPPEIKRASLNALYTFSEIDLAYALSCFVREVKKVDGGEFPPIIMLQMYLHENGIYWRLLEHDSFRGFRNILDNTMKQRTAMGLGMRVSSSVISLSQEDKLFREGILGDEEPKQLLQTVIYMLGLHLALHGGVEHSQLRRPGYDSQIIFNVYDQGRERLKYVEDPLQKTNQGGIGARNSSKVVYVYQASNQKCCPVRIFKKYVRLLLPAKTCKKLYLRPKQKFSPQVWYCDQPYGNNKVSSTVK